MKSYVVGLCFNESKSLVYLVLKAHGPSAVVGKWNGIGGGIESGETPMDAMVREWQEEVKAILPYRWRYFLKLHHPEVWEVYFFETTASINDVPKGINDVGELMSWRGATGLNEVVPNLRWIVPMALDKDGVVGVVEDLT